MDLEASKEYLPRIMSLKYSTEVKVVVSKLYHWGEPFDLLCSFGIKDDSQQGKQNSSAACLQLLAGLNSKQLETSELEKIHSLRLFLVDYLEVQMQHA